jgi:hypothetical protein
MMILQHVGDAQWTAPTFCNCPTTDVSRETLEYAIVGAFIHVSRETPLYHNSKFITHHLSFFICLVCFNNEK